MIDRQSMKATGNHRFARFLRDESGVIAPQILIFFFLMLLVGGVAVDLMRFEGKRVALQQTMDRATIAAAALENSLDPREVVESYMETSGVDGELIGVQVDQALNSRIVKAEATVRSNNYFMSMMEQPYLQALNASLAEQRISNIEIMMVLDVSGSMAGAKITNLRAAARDFVDTVKAKDDLARVSIGMIPYNAQVNLGPVLRTKYNLTHNHGVSTVNCVELPASVYSSLALSRSLAMPLMAPADVVNSTTTSSSYVDPNGSQARPGNTAASNWCDPNARSYITMPTTTAATVKTAISALNADGNTSIMLGMRWATALLDPSARSIYSEYMAANLMPTTMVGRPQDYDDAEVMKVIILMTDGQHVAHVRVPDAYKTGTSPIYLSNDGRFSIFHDRSGTTSDYWVPHTGAWQSTPFGGTSGSTRLDWSEVWKRERVSWVAWQLYGRPNGTTAYNNFLKATRVTYASATTMDSWLSQNCAAARAAGVLIYGIAFEAPASGANAIRDCASKPASTYFFDANGLEIHTAFQLIASNLSQLRLTQ